MLPAQPASKLGSLLRLVLFADWISAQFSLTLDLLSLQSPHPHRPALPPQSRYCWPSLISSATGSQSRTHFLYFREREKKRESLLHSFFGSSRGVERYDRFTHLCHSDKHHGPCLPASPPGDDAAKRLWGIFVALPAKHLLPITQRGQL